MNFKHLLLAAAMSCLCILSAQAEKVTVLKDGQTREVNISKLSIKKDGGQRTILLNGDTIVSVTDDEASVNLPDSTIETIVEQLNQLDGIESLSALKKIGVLSGSYDLDDVEHFIRRIRPKTEEELLHEYQSDKAERTQNILITFIAIAMPLLIVFMFLGYRQHRKSKEEEMRQQTLREMAKSGATITPEVIAAVYGKANTRVMVHPTQPRPSAAPADGASIGNGSAETNQFAATAETPTSAAAPVYVEDPAETKKKTEKAINNLILGFGFCFTATILIFFQFGEWGWVFFIPGFILLAQGGSYILTKVVMHISDDNASAKK